MPIIVAIEKNEDTAEGLILTARGWTEGPECSTVETEGCAEAGLRKCFCGKGLGWAGLTCCSRSLLTWCFNSPGTITQVPGVVPGTEQVSIFAGTPPETELPTALFPLAGHCQFFGETLFWVPVFLTPGRSAGLALSWGVGGVSMLCLNTQFLNLLFFQILGSSDSDPKAESYPQFWERFCT